MWTWNYTKFMVREDSGYHLFFKSSIAGVVFLILATQLLSFSVFSDYFEFKSASKLIPNGFESASILAMIMGIAFAYFLNIFYSRTKGLTRAAEDRGKYLYLTIQEAFNQWSMIEVTLSSRKVYIGSPLSEMPFDSEDLNLIPYFSGYRERETNELIVSRKYAREMKSIVDADLNSGDQMLSRKFQVTVRTNDIMSVRLFYPEIFERLNDERFNS